MAATQGAIRFHQDDQRLTFRVEGQATMKQSLAFRRFAEQALKCQDRIVCVDLRDCAYMDSTFVGTLLYLLRAADHRGPDGFALVSPSRPCADVLGQMGVDHLFRIFSEEGLPAESWRELTRESDDGVDLQRNILQAHKELANVPGSAAEAFRSVVRCLEREMGADASARCQE